MKSKKSQFYQDNANMVKLKKIIKSSKFSFHLYSFQCRSKYKSDKISSTK